MSLWQHQQLGVERARKLNHLAIFYETGTGKTATTIEILKEDFARGDSRPFRVLIFSPMTVCKQWKLEIEKFWPNCPLPIHVLTGPGAKRTRFLKENKDLAGIVITNYEGMRIGSFHAELLAWAPKILVCDESHRLKDAQSLQSKKIYPLASQASRRFILTGTPILNSELDLFGQFKILDPGVFGHNFYSYRARYFYDKNAGMPSYSHFPDWRPRPGVASEIAGLISNCSVQAKKEQCLDLPPLHQINVPVEMSNMQRIAYRSMEATCVAEINEQVVLAEFAMTKVLRLQQLLCGYIPDDEKNPLWMDEIPRLEVLAELLESIGPFQKVIVWTTFRATYPVIGELLTKMKRSHAFLTGDQSIHEKEKAIEGFRSRDTQVLVANPAAGGTGINLTEAAYAIYFNLGYSLEHYLQSSARNYRGGSDIHEKITQYCLYAPGTLDEVIMQALTAKADVGARILAWARDKSAERH